VTVLLCLQYFNVACINSMIHYLQELLTLVICVLAFSSCITCRHAVM